MASQSEDLNGEKKFLFSKMLFLYYFLLSSSEQHCHLVLR